MDGPNFPTADPTNPWAGMMKTTYSPIVGDHPSNAIDKVYGSVSPYLIMSAQQGNKGSIEQLGKYGLQMGLVDPGQAAAHGEGAGVYPKGTTQKIIAQSQKSKAASGGTGRVGALPPPALSQGPGGVGGNAATPPSNQGQPPSLPQPQGPAQIQPPSQGTPTLSEPPAPVQAPPGAPNLSAKQGPNLTGRSPAELSDLRQQQLDMLGKFQGRNDARLEENDKKNGLDLTGLMTAADWTNNINKFVPAYKPPKDNSQELMNNQSTLANKYGQIAHETAGEQSDAVRAAKPTGSANPAAYGPVNQFMTRTASEGKNLQRTGSMITNLISALGSGNPTEYNSVKTQLATLMENGFKPQLQAIMMEGGDTSVPMKVLSMAQKAADGTMRPEQVGQYKLAAQHLLDTHNQNLGAYVNRAKVMNSRLPSPLNDEEFKAAVTAPINPHGAASQTTLDNLPNPKGIKKLNPNSNDESDPDEEEKESLRKQIKDLQDQAAIRGQ